jgi:hypothetical protein
VRKLESIAKAEGLLEYDQAILQFPEGHEGTERREPPGRLRPRCVLRVATKATCVDPWIWLSMNENEVSWPSKREIPLQGCSALRNPACSQSE